MRLPPIPRGFGVQRHARKDVNLPLQEAQAEGAMLTTAGSIAANAANVAQEMYTRERQQEFRQGKITAQTKVSEFRKLYDGKETVSAREVNPDLIPSGYGVKTLADPNRPGTLLEVSNNDIPIHMVYPELSRQNMKDAITEGADGIKNEADRAKFSEEMGLVAAQQDAQITSNMLKVQTQFQRKQDVSQIQNAIKEGQYDQAMMLAETSNRITEEEREAFQLAAGVGGETEIYHNVINNKNVPMMEEYLANLTSDEYGGLLTEKQRAPYISQMRSAIRAEKDAEESVDQELRQIAVDKGNDMIKALKANSVIDPEKFNAVAEGLEKYDDRSLLRELYIGAAYHDTIGGFLASTPSEKAAFLNDLASGKIGPLVPGDETADITLTKLIKEAGADFVMLQKKDTIQAARDIRLFETDPLDLQNFDGWLSKRYSQVRQAERVLGTATGVFDTTSEMVEFTGHYNSLDKDGKIALMGQMAQKEYSDIIYDQLRNNGITDPFIAAGKIHSEGAPQIAKDVLAGFEILEAHPKIIKGIDIEIDSAVLKQIGEAYRGNPVQEREVINAVKSLYAQDVRAQGKSEADVFKSSINETAVNKVTGGILEFGGTELESFERGLSQRGFERWWQDTHFSYLDDIGLDTYADSDKVWSMMQEGDLQIVPVKKNKAVLFNPSNNTTVRNKDGKNFYFKYDPNSIKNSTYMNVKNSDLLQAFPTKASGVDPTVKEGKLPGVGTFKRKPGEYEDVSEWQRNWRMTAEQRKISLE